MTNIDQLALDAATSAIDPKVLIGPRCQVKARVQVIIADAIRARAQEEAESYQRVIRDEHGKREALDQELAACRDYANDQAAIFGLLAKALGVPEEPHQGMAERVLEAAEALAAHHERMRKAALDAIHYLPGGEVKAELRDAYDEAPTTSLARLKAQVAEEERAAISSKCAEFKQDGEQWKAAHDEVAAREQALAAYVKDIKSILGQGGEVTAARGASAYRAGAGVSDNPYLHDAAPHPGELAHEWQRGWDNAKRQAEGLTISFVSRDAERQAQALEDMADRLESEEDNGLADGVCYAASEMRKEAAILRQRAQRRDERKADHE